MVLFVNLEGGRLRSRGRGGDLRLVEVLKVAGKDEICSARVSAVLFCSFLSFPWEWKTKRKFLSRRD